jgi:hypothetical protein
VAEIVATDPLMPPQADTAAALPDLVKRAWETRPDVRQASLAIAAFSPPLPTGKPLAPSDFRGSCRIQCCV